MEEDYPQTFSRIFFCSELFINHYININTLKYFIYLQNINALKYFIYLFQILQCFMEVWGFQSQKQNLFGKKIKLLFRFMYFLKVKFCLWDFCNSQNQIYLLWPKKQFCVRLKEKKSCHKNLILGKHILCLHKIATMGPASIISVVCAFNCFSNNSERGHTIDPNQYFTLSFWDKKIKVTLEYDATKTVIFCLWLHPKPWEMCSICSALEPSPPRRLVFGLSFPSKLTCAVFGCV